LWSITRAISFTKQIIIRKEEGMTIYLIYKKNHPIMPKDVVNVYDRGYLGVEKDFPERKSSLPYKKKRNQKELPQEEKEKTEFIPTKRE
jgi:hypothetical protein